MYEHSQFLGQRLYTVSVSPDSGFHTMGVYFLKPVYPSLPIEYPGTLLPKVDLRRYTK